MLLARSSQEPWEMAGIGGFEIGKMAGHHYCSALLLRYPTVLLYMVGPNSPKVTLSQSPHGMKKRKEKNRAL